MNADPAIVVEGVSKTFVVPHARRSRLKDYVMEPLAPRSADRLEALKDVSLTVRCGEFLGVIGPNGSGKSTLLKLLAGIYRADTGTIRVNGRLSPFIELGVGFNPELTARDNIGINGTLIGMTRREVTEKTPAILRFAELERFADQRLKNFSSGMLVRLGYAISIQVPFEILLVDEVLAVGDAAFQEKCFETFEEVIASGRTIVFVSHDLDAIARYADRAVLVDAGRLAAAGEPEVVIDRYLARLDGARAAARYERRPRRS